MEKMTDKELEQLKKLQAKQKRIQREQDAFKKQVLENRVEVLHILGADKVMEPYYENKLKELSGKYGMTINTFFEIFEDNFIVTSITKWFEDIKAQRRNNVQTNNSTETE